MKLGVSNLMWAPAFDDEVATVLAELGVDRIDLAPSRYFPASLADDASRTDAVRAYWERQGVRIIGLQSLLHEATVAGEPTPALLGSPAAFAPLERILRQRIAQAAALGAQVLVFGSWPHRLRGHLSLERAVALAAARFGPLADAAAAAGIQLGIEPIDAGYGNDFLVNHDEAAMLVRAIGHAAFGLVLDVGCAGLATEDLRAVLQRHGELVCHVQLAERGLAPLTDSDWHAKAGPILSAWLAQITRDGREEPGVCIEALTPDGTDPAEATRHSIEVARRWYS